MARESITLACAECKSRNYISSRNKKQGAERLELKKFCPKCGKHMSHRETK